MALNSKQKSVLVKVGIVIGLIIVALVIRLVMLSFDKGGVIEQAQDVAPVSDVGTAQNEEDSAQIDEEPEKQPADDKPQEEPVPENKYAGKEIDMFAAMDILQMCTWYDPKTDTTMNIYNFSILEEIDGERQTTYYDIKKAYIGKNSETIMEVDFSDYDTREVYLSTTIIVKNAPKNSLNAQHQIISDGFVGAKSYLGLPDTYK